MRTKTLLLVSAAVLLVPLAVSPSFAEEYETLDDVIELIERKTGTGERLKCRMISTVSTKSGSRYTGFGTVRRNGKQFIQYDVNEPVSFFPKGYGIHFSLFAEPHRAAAQGGMLSRRRFISLGFEQPYGQSSSAAESTKTASTLRNGTHVGLSPFIYPQHESLGKFTSPSYPLLYILYPSFLKVHRGAVSVNDQPDKGQISLNYDVKPAPRSNGTSISMTIDRSSGRIQSVTLTRGLGRQWELNFSISSYREMGDVVVPETMQSALRRRFNNEIKSEYHVDLRLTDVNTQTNESMNAPGWARDPALLHRVSFDQEALDDAIEEHPDQADLVAARAFAELIPSRKQLRVGILPRVFQSLRDEPEAFKRFTEVLRQGTKHHAKSPVLHSQLLSGFLLSGAFSDVDKLGQQLRDKNLLFPELNFSIAINQVERMKREQARSLLEPIRDHNPIGANARSLLLLLEAQHHSEPEQLLNVVDRLTEPYSFTIQAQIIRSLTKSGGLELADGPRSSVPRFVKPLVTHLKKKKKVPDPLHHLILARVFKKREQFSKSISHYRKIRSADVRWNPVFHELEDILRRKPGSFPEVIQNNLERITIPDIYSGYAVSLVESADVEDKRKRIEQTVRAFLNFLKQNRHRELYVRSKHVKPIWSFLNEHQPALADTFLSTLVLQQFTSVDDELSEPVRSTLSDRELYELAIKQDRPREIKSILSYDSFLNMARDRSSDDSFSNNAGKLFYKLFKQERKDLSKKQKQTILTILSDHAGGRGSSEMHEWIGDIHYSLNQFAKSYQSYTTFLEHEYDKEYSEDQYYSWMEHRYRQRSNIHPSRRAGGNKMGPVETFQLDGSVIEKWALSAKKAKKSSEALTFLSKKLAPGRTVIRCWTVARAYMTLGETTKARSFLKIKFDQIPQGKVPFKKSPGYDLYLYYRSNDRVTDAIELLKKASNRELDVATSSLSSDSATHQLITVYKTFGHTSKLIERLKTIVRHQLKADQPFHFEGSNETFGQRLIRLLLQKEQTEKAIQWLEKMSKKERNQSEPFPTVIRLVRNGREAIKQTSATYKLAQLYNEQGMTDKYVNLLKNASSAEREKREKVLIYQTKTERGIELHHMPATRMLVKHYRQTDQEQKVRNLLRKTSDAEQNKRLFLYRYSATKQLVEHYIDQDEIGEAKSLLKTVSEQELSIYRKRGGIIQKIVRKLRRNRSFDNKRQNAIIKCLKETPLSGTRRLIKLYQETRESKKADALRAKIEE